MSDNGFSKQEQIKFPVRFVLKAFFDNSIPEKEHIINLKNLFLKLGVEYKSFSSKLSSNGKYISISVGVKVDDNKIFQKIYEELKQIPGIKYAI